MPRFSVIITSFNRPVLVGQAIRTVREQTFGDFELIVADDDSHPKTIEAIYAAIGNDKRCRVIEQAGGKVGHISERSQKTRYCITINRALREVQGEFIKYGCDDDAHYAGCLQGFVEAFDAHPEAHLAHCMQRSITCDESSYWDSRGKPKLLTSWPLPNSAHEGTHHDVPDPDSGRPLEIASWQPGYRRPVVGLDHNMFSHRYACLEELGSDPWPVVDMDRDVGDTAVLRRFDLLGHASLAVPVLGTVKLYHGRNEDKARHSEWRE